MKLFELFEKHRIRSSKAINKTWFSVVDICAALLDSDYQTARNYWKWLKHKLILQGNPLVMSINQLKLEAFDGKLRYTDVMDIKDVLQLIQLCPSQKASAFKLWIAKLAAKGRPVLKRLKTAILKACDMVDQRADGFILTVICKEFDVLSEPEEAQVY